MTAIDQKEIKGINLKHLIAILGSTITIVVSVMVGINKVNSRIDQQTYLIEKIMYMNETEIRTIKVRLDIIEQHLAETKLSKATTITQINK